MRVLLTDPAAARPALYRRYLRRALYRGCLAGTMSAVSSYLSLNAVMLGRAERDSLADLTTKFARIFNKAGEQVAADQRDLVEYGFPWSFAELIQEDPVRPVILGRFDFLLDDAGEWQLVEYNSDTPSGLREAIAADEAAFALLGRRVSSERVNRELAERVIDAFRRELAGLPRPLRIGFVTDSYHLEDMAQTIFTERLVRDRLAGEGVETVIGDIKNLDVSRGHPTLIGRRIDALNRYFPFEALIALPQFVVIVEAVARGRLRLLNGPRGLLLQNKGLMAWIWAHHADPVFTPAEQIAIRDHLPATWWIRNLPPAADRQSIVVKQVFGREGEEVYLGDRMADEDWSRVREWGTFVGQRRVATRPVTAVSWDWKGEPFAAERWPSVGSFAASDEFAGVYTRLGSPILTSQAEFAPTFVEE